MQAIYDFFNPLGDRSQVITDIGISWQYWLPVVLSFISLSFLFIFKNGYVKLAGKRWFLVSLGSFQIFLYFLYYFINFLYLYYFKVDYNSETPTVKGWTWLMPLHLSSITQLFSGYLLIKPNDKLFSITAPWVVIMVFASFLIPADKYYGPQHFYYWIYYVFHIIIIFAYWFIYMYGLAKFEKKYLLWSFIFLMIFSLIALGYNGLSLVIARVSNEVTNLLYLGTQGYDLTKTISTANIWTGGINNNLWPLGYIFLFTFGVTFTTLGFAILSKVQPFYEKQGDKFLALKRTSTTWGWQDFKIMFKNWRVLWEK